MKETKKQGRKAIPLCYRRRRSRSNTSLSQLVHIASYKKRINDLSRNNRLLAVALQESRVEVALQSNVLKDYARDSNQIMFARIKLNEMAKTISKFITDLDEVRNYLNIDLPINNNLPQKNGSPSERIVKVPNVSCIEEVSVISTENETSATEKTPEVISNSDLKSSQKPDDKISPDIQPSTSECDTHCASDVEMAPILFVDNTEEKDKKNSSRSKHSKISNNADKESLTPELDIDLTCLKRKRTSSRRMTQFNFPETRTTRSRGKTASSGKKNSNEELVTPVRPSSPLLMHLEQNPVEANGLQEEISKSPFTETIKQRESKNLKFIQDDPSDIEHISASNLPDAPVTHLPESVGTDVLPSIQQAGCNHTVLLCEDMELTEVVRPVNEVIIDNDLPTVVKPMDIPEINSNISEENIEHDTSDKQISSEQESPKLSDSPQNTAMMSDDIQLPEILDTECDKEIQNVGMLTFCDEGDGNVKNSESFKNDIFSPYVKRSRPKKAVKYAVFFSSDESDKDSPVKPVLNRKKCVKQLTSPVKSELCEKTSEATTDYLSIQKTTSEVENKMPKNDYSVYNLDVSNSKQQGKKSKGSKNKKANTKKDLPKPLFQKCSVTKLKAGSYKFSKNETPEKLKAITEQLKKCSVIGLSPSISPGGILKKAVPDPSQKNVDKEVEIVLNVSDCGDNVKNKQVPSSINHIKIRDILETPKSESKRVSFAPTDLVCNFRGMSVSKDISANRKVRRTSKSVLDFEEIIKEAARSKATTNLGTDISSENTASKKVDQTNLFNFSGDTELYTFTFPSNTRLPTLPVDDLLQPSKSAIPVVADKTKNLIDNSKNGQHTQKTLLILKSPKQTGKLSLKKNKTSQKTALSCISDKIETKTIFLQSESPKSVVTKTKRKSLFKELPDDLKENVCFDPQTPEKPKDVLQVKPHIPENSPLSSANICNKKSSSNGKRRSKVNSKTSLKRNNLSDKHNLLQPVPEVTSKKSSLQMKPLEGSPLLKDVLNLTITENEDLPKRRSKTVSYKEISLRKKLRRE